MFYAIMLNMREKQVLLKVKFLPSIPKYFISIDICKNKKNPFVEYIFSKFLMYHI